MVEHLPVTGDSRVLRDVQQPDSVYVRQGTYLLKVVQNKFGECSVEKLDLGTEYEKLRKCVIYFGNYYEQVADKTFKYFSNAKQEEQKEITISLPIAQDMPWCSAGPLLFYSADEKLFVLNVETQQ